MIQFKCYLPEVLNKYPITKISKKDFNWVSKAFDYYKNNPSNLQTTKCLDRDWETTFKLYHL